MKPALITALLVGLGGFIGALARYGLSGLTHRLFSASTFPLGTMAVNLIGCLLIGVLAGLSESRQLLTSDFRTFAMIGILGGFTTFSAFGYETVALLRNSQYASALLNVVLQVLLGVALVWLGYALATR